MKALSEISALIAEQEGKIANLKAKEKWYYDTGDLKSYHFCRGMLSTLESTVTELYSLKQSIRALVDLI